MAYIPYPKGIGVLRHFYKAPQGTKGAESSRILKQAQGVDARPPADENTRLLKNYLELVYQDQWNDPKAVGKRQLLNEIFGSQEPALTEADLYVDQKGEQLEFGF